MSHLIAQDITYRVSHKALLSDINLTIVTGRFTVIIGPNGAGKSTLIKLLTGDLGLQQGSIRYLGEPLAIHTNASLARNRAVLPQIQALPFALPVADVVALGREPWHGRAEAQHNSAIIQHCLKLLTIDHLAHHTYQTLSGGEQHRTQIARALAQILATPDCDLTGKTLFLDEPTNHLDIRHQYQLMHTLQNLKARGLTIIAVMHDLDLTLQNADHIVLLHEGQKLGDYTAQTLTESGDLERAYHIRIRHYRPDGLNRTLLAPEYIHSRSHST